MQMIESLQIGWFGIELQLPSHLKISRDEEQYAELFDESTEVAWFCFFFPDLHLDLGEEHRADLERSLEWYARSIFDDTFRQLGHVDNRLQPRTADSSWSPLVDVENLSLDGAPALRTIHRTSYAPGSEIMLGHLLIPLRRGLFEARVACGDGMTGYRESQLFEKRARERAAKSEEGLESVAAELQQADLDDPQHDDAFPEHCLSRARTVMRWLCTESDLRVTELPSPIERSHVDLSYLECALVPPPRFVYDPPGDPSQEGCFHRVSFCGTDGLERLHVDRWDSATVESASNLPRVAEAIARELHEGAGVEDMRVAVDVLPPLDQRPRMLVVVEGTGHMGSLRNAMSFFFDEQGRLWSLSRFGIAAVPLDALVAELDAAARSFRILRHPRQRRSWWRLQ